MFNILKKAKVLFSIRKNSIVPVCKAINGKKISELPKLFEISPSTEVAGIDNGITYRIATSLINYHAYNNIIVVKNIEEISGTLLQNNKVYFLDFFTGTLTNTISLPENCSIIGLGREKTAISWTGTGDIFHFDGNGATNVFKNMVISHISFFGTSGHVLKIINNLPNSESIVFRNVSTSSMSGLIGADNISNVEIYSCHFVMTGEVLSSIVLSDCTNFILDNSSIIDAAGNSIVLFGETKFLKITSNNIVMADGNAATTIVLTTLTGTALNAIITSNIVSLGVGKTFISANPDGVNLDKTSIIASNSFHGETSNIFTGITNSENKWRFTGNTGDDSVYDTVTCAYISMASNLTATTFISPTFSVKVSGLSSIDYVSKITGLPQLSFSSADDMTKKIIITVNGSLVNSIASGYCDMWFYIYKNGAQSGPLYNSHANGKVRAFSFTRLETMVNGDTFELMLANKSNTDPVIIRDCQIYVREIR